MKKYKILGLSFWFITLIVFMFLLSTDKNTNLVVDFINNTGSQNVVFYFYVICVSLYILCLNLVELLGFKKEKVIDDGSI